MAIDGHRSTFVGGGSIDQFTEMVDLSPNEKVAAQRWQTLKLQESLTSNEQIEFNNLTTQLSKKIFSAEKFNTLADCIVALEIFFRDNVEGYIETKQQEFDATLQKFSDKGTYNNAFNYMQWNTILYNYEGYISRKDNNLNHTPIGDETDIWWQKIAQRGSQGQPGLGLRFTGLFSISKTYSENDAVAYYGDDGYAIYYCLSSCMGIEPTDENYWAVFMSLAQLSSIIGDTNDLLTEDKSSLVNAFNEVFLSVSSGKTQLETAITDMRGAVSKEKEIVSFNELESGVRSIPISKGNALPQYVLEPYTFTNEDGIEYTGTMPNRGAVNHSLPINGSFTISQGCHNGLGKVTQSISTKGAATYNPSQSDQIITSGQYLYGNQTIKAVTFDASKVLNDTTIAGKKGNMANQGAKIITPSTANQAILGGYHNGSGYVKGDADLVPANIKSGVNIFGVAGTAGTIINKQNGSYVFNTGTSANITISAVDLTKAIVRITVECDGSLIDTQYIAIQAKITNATTVTLQRYASNSSYSVTVKWEVIEFDNVKSLQRGNTDSDSYSPNINITISRVNINKSLVFATHYYSTDGKRPDAMIFSTELTAPTTLRLGVDTARLFFVHWQVIEFN